MGVSDFFQKTQISAFFQVENQLAVKNKITEKIESKFILGRMVSALRASTIAPTLSLRLRVSLSVTKHKKW